MVDTDCENCVIQPAVIYLWQDVEDLLDASPGFLLCECEWKRQGLGTYDYYPSDFENRDDNIDQSFPYEHDGNCCQKEACDF